MYVLKGYLPRLIRRFAIFNRGRRLKTTISGVALASFNIICSTFFLILPLTGSFLTQQPKAQKFPKYLYKVVVVDLPAYIWKTLEFRTAAPEDSCMWKIDCTIDLEHQDVKS